jgi:hypothetical protein
MGRVGHAHLGIETTAGQANTVGGGPETCIQMGGDVERKGHRAIEELRLALSKKHFRGCAGLAHRCFPAGINGGENPILGSTKLAKTIASPSFAPQGAAPITLQCLP